MNSRLPCLCCMRVENDKLAVWSKDDKKETQRTLKDYFLTKNFKNPYLINNRGDLRGQARGLT